MTKKPSQSNNVVTEDLEVMTYHDISREYHLVCAKCELLWKHPDSTSELASK